MKNQKLTEQDILTIISIHNDDRRHKMKRLTEYAEKVGKPANTIKQMIYRIEKDLQLCDLSKPPGKSYKQIIYDLKKSMSENGGNE